MAFVFLAETDFDFRIDSGIRDQITGNNDTLVEEAERSAMAMIEDALGATYDLDEEFAKTGIDRHRSLIRMMLSLVIYFIYEGVPSLQVPERVVKNYDDVIAELKGLESGKRNSTLTKLVDETTGKNPTVFRWGSNTKRTHTP